MEDEPQIDRAQARNVCISGIAACVFLVACVFSGLLLAFEMTFAQWDGLPRGLYEVYVILLDMIPDTPGMVMSGSAFLFALALLGYNHYSDSTETDEEAA